MHALLNELMGCGGLAADILFAQALIAMLTSPGGRCAAERIKKQQNI